MFHHDLQNQDPETRDRRPRPETTWVTHLRGDTLPYESLAGAWRPEQEEALGGAAEPCTGLK